MILNFLALITIYLSIIGFSVLLKYLINSFSIKEINNLDIIYGIFLLSFIAIFFHFLLPLKSITYFIIIIGILLFLYSVIFRNIKININFLIIFPIIFFYIFISYNTPTLGDSSLYHLQTIKWFTNYKISFGIANLEPRLGVNSLWHLFLSLFNIKLQKIQTIYFLSAIIHSVLIYEVFLNRKNTFNFSNLFLVSSVFFILIFTIIHPFANGTIYNLIGSPENDSVVMCLFIITIYLFIKLIEHKDKSIEYLNLIILFSTIAALSKLSHLSLLLIPFMLVVVFGYSKIFRRINILAFLLFFLMLIRSIILSGCVFFPVAKTCIKNLSWGLPIKDVNTAGNIYKSFARDTPLRAKWTDFDHTLNSFDWFYPWLTEYVFNTAFFIILFLLILISIFLYIIATLLKFSSNYKITNLSTFLYTIGICYFFTLYIWFQSPAIRYAYGPFISFGSLLLSSIVFINYSKIILKLKLILNYSTITFLILLCLSLIVFKNKNNFNSIAGFPNKNEEPANISFLSDVNKNKIYTSYACGYFLQICVSEPYLEYKITKKLNYLFFSRVSK